MLEILLFSLPSIAASLLEPLASVVDTALVGHLDTTLLAALAIGTTILSSFTWMFNFLIHASTQAIASAKNIPLGSRANVSFSVAIIVSLLTCLFLYLFRFNLYELVGAKPSQFELIDQYFVVRVYGHPAAILYMTALSILRGLSKVRTALWFVLLTTGINIFFTWLFLYHFEMGINGAALGTVISNVVGTIITLIALAMNEKVRDEFFKTPPLEQWLSFGKNSLDLFGRSAAITGSLFLAVRFATQLGEVNLAAHQILLQAWLFVSFFIDGIAITANIKGSEYSKDLNLSALKLLIKRVLILGGALGAVFSVIYFIFDQQTQRIFTDDALVLTHLRNLWWLIAISQIPNALAFVYDGILFGLGDNGGFKWVRRWMLIGAIFVFFPIAYFGTGLYEIWLGLICLNIFRLITGFWTTRFIVNGMKTI